MGSEAKPTKASEINLNLTAHTVTFVFPDAIPDTAQTIVLSIEYSGFLNNQMAGFYRSSYKDINGNTKIMASTQFESLDARRAFPCIDEPGVKSVFGLTLTIPSDRLCFSNMPEDSVVSLSATKKRVKFLDSPIMSTYLVAFCVGEFDFVQAQGPHGVLVRVYTPPGKSDQGTFALKAAVLALEAYNDFFKIPYCLPKLDMVAIPEFAMGAMENWGLVTYREVDLLIDPIKASSQQKQRVAVVVAHELAHQWFGNLVTMQWWDDLWLNEGFAAWAEHWAVDKQFPDYKMWEQFTTGHLASGMRADSLRSSHPIQVPIKHAEEVEQVFDSISYCKGASVVRMIRAVLGSKHFQEGLSNYMKKYAYSNTETFDLWSAWEEVSKVPVGEMMNSWTEQMGFPLVRVVKEDWQEDKVTLELDQMWFLSDGSPLSEEEAAKKWTIPILTCTEAGTQADMTLMREKTATVTVSTKSWVKLNAGQEVPMRVLLGPEMLKRLSSGIRDKTISPIDRAGLINDAYALVKAGHMSPESLIELLVSYKDEDNYIVWEGISSVLGGIDAILSNDETMSTFFENFAKDYVLKLLDKVGWDSKETDGHLTTLLRNIMVNLLSTFSYYDPEVAKEAKTRFEAVKADRNDVKALPSDLRTPVFKIYLKNGGAKEYEDLLSYFRDASDDAERRQVFSSIGHTPDPKLKKAAMDWALSGEVKTQDIIWPLGSVGHSNKEGQEISWQFYKENFDRLKGIFEKASPTLMSHVIVMCAGGFCSSEKADEIEKFFVDHPLPSCTRKISQVVENMRANAKLLDMMKASALSKAEFWSAL